MLHGNASMKWGSPVSKEAASASLESGTRLSPFRSVMHSRHAINVKPWKYFKARGTQIVESATSAGKSPNPRAKLLGP